jgi:hypothetical protein
MNNDEMRNIINISEGIVKNPDGTPKTFKRTAQMKAKKPTGIDRFLGRGKTDDWDEYPLPKKPKGVERRTHDHEKAHGINEHSADGEMGDDAQEILTYLDDLANFGDERAAELAGKMDAIYDFVTKDEMTEGFEDRDRLANIDGVFPDGWENPAEEYADLPIDAQAALDQFVSDMTPEEKQVFMMWKNKSQAGEIYNGEPVDRPDGMEFDPIVHADGDTATVRSISPEKWAEFKEIAGGDDEKFSKLVSDMFGADE